MRIGTLEAVHGMKLQPLISPANATLTVLGSLLKDETNCSCSPSKSTAQPEKGASITRNSGCLFPGTRVPEPGMGFSGDTDTVQHAIQCMHSADQPDAKQHSTFESWTSGVGTLAAFAQHFSEPRALKAHFASLLAVSNFEPSAPSSTLSVSTLSVDLRLLTTSLLPVSPPTAIC